MKRPPRQGALFDKIEQDAGGAESAATYAAVTKLRAAGHKVSRAGAHHVVDGKRLSLRELADLVARLFPQGAVSE